LTRWQAASLPDSFGGKAARPRRQASSLSSAQILPLLQRDWDVPVFPNEIVERAEIEFFALLHSRVGEKFHDLEFADLIGDGLAGTGREGNCFLTGGI